MRTQTGALMEELRLQPTLERVNVPSYVIDRDGIVRWLNPAAIALVGDVRGRHFTSVVTPREVSRAKTQFERTVMSDRPSDFETTIHGDDGGSVRIGISSAPLHQGGRVVGVFGLVARPPKRRTTPFGTHPHLTPRQHQVLVLLAEGASTHQIAGELTLSVETVRNHIRAMMSRLDASSRLEAVAIARREGILD